MRLVPACVTIVLPFVRRGRYPAKFGTTWPDRMLTVSAEAVDAFAAAKASLVGMKTVMKGVESRASVRFKESVRETKVVSPVDSAVEEREEGTVKKLGVVG